jgi:hypothetical protein
MPLLAAVTCINGGGARFRYWAGTSFRPMKLLCLSPHSLADPTGARKSPERLKRRMAGCLHDASVDPADDTTHPAVLRWLGGWRRSQRAASCAGKTLFTHAIGITIPYRVAKPPDTEETGVVYSSRSGRVPRGRGSHEVTETRLVGDVHRIKAPQSGVLLPVCSCMFGWRSPRGHEDG